MKVPRLIVKGACARGEAANGGAIERRKASINGTPILAGGTYHICSLEAGQTATVLFQDETTMSIQDKFALGQKSTFGPEEGSGIEASDILA